ncbi:hypothetical protein LCGC14_1710490 [marine sediment metagenome]|uniref:Phage Gp37Gp68 family protein n=1 Tax=marine sediment metagenome TaxID=412755 RepID=A0A0F9KFF5_9ZZZZ
MGSKIEWTEETWNPIIGCSKVSPGCDHCYAERMANRLAHIDATKPHYGIAVKDGKWTGKTLLGPDSVLEKPLHWKKPRTIFICSMGDMFHESVPVHWIFKVFPITQKCPQHTFFILTKRPEIMQKYFNYTGIRYPYLNVWLAVTAENQEQADKRIPILLGIPAVKRFVSVEPMLSLMDISKYLKVVNESGFQDYGGPFAGRDKLDWVICGGESGSGARPMNINWVRSLRDQCIEGGTPFFFKQWGEWHPNWHEMAEFDIDYSQRHISMNFDDGMSMIRVGKKKAGRKLDRQIWDQRP